MNFFHHGAPACSCVPVAFELDGLRVVDFFAAFFGAALAAGFLAVGFFAVAFFLDFAAMVFSYQESGCRSGAYWL
jgi:hypothetical protein